MEEKETNKGTENYGDRAKKRIENWAYNNNMNLKKIVIGRFIEEIGESAFGNGCSSLEEIAVHPQNTHFYVEDNCLIDARTGELRLSVGIPKIPDSVRCVKLNYAFEQFATFEELYIGKSLEKLELGDSCRNCGFNRIVLHPDNQHFEIINNCLFYRNGTELLIGGIECVIPEKTTKIGSHAFAWSDRGRMHQITIPKNVVSIGSFAFTFAGIKSIRIPKSVISIERSAFYGCHSLKTVEFENGLKCIKDRAFCASGIETLHLPGSVQSVEKNAFESCDHLRIVTGLGGVKEISDSLFYRCKALTSVVLPPTLKIIKSCAFGDCTKLTSFEIPKGVTKIEGDTFSRCASLEKVVMSDSVKEIGSCIFENCKALKEVRLSNSLRTIPMRAFGWCESLREITMPPSVKKLEDFCFEGCTALESINIDNVTKIDRDAFEGCTKLPDEMKKLPKTKTKTVTKNPFPDELWSHYNSNDLLSEANVDEEMHFITVESSVFVAIYHGGFEYEDVIYLRLSQRGRIFFVDIDYEFDEKENVPENCYRATVYDQEHLFFPELEAAFNKECEEE